MSKKKTQEEAKADRKKRILRKIAEYEELEKSWADFEQISTRHIDFRKGVILGLILGIIGNFFVQFSYSAYERAMIGSLDLLFWSNLLICGLVLAIVLHRIRRYKLELKEEYRKIGLEGHEQMRARWIITDLKKLLLEEDS